jgi:hypothetical protein
MKEFEIDDEYKIVFNNDTEHWDYHLNSQPLPKTVDLLYKFYGLNINNLDSLLNNYFYLSNPGDFNDPFDCNINLIENNDLFEIDKLNIVQRNKYGNIGVCSFSETIDNHLMWAHYTNNYQGFALKFKGDNIKVLPQLNQFKKQTLTRVIYPSSLKLIKREYSFAQHYVFTNKLKHWSYEKEWRIIAELGDTMNRILYYEPKSVEALFVGHKLIDYNESAYRLILGIHSMRFPDIPIFVVYPHKKELKLFFEKVLN